jgi:hypothetical protein
MLAAAIGAVAIPRTRITSPYPKLAHIKEVAPSAIEEQVTQGLLGTNRGDKKTGRLASRTSYFLQRLDPQCR